MGSITALAYLAAVMVLILFVWMLRDVFGAKEQVFKKDERDSLDLLRREISHMEYAVTQHLALLEKARQSFSNTEYAAVCAVYAQVAADLKQIAYDRSVFVDKGITRPGQCCYNIYKRLSQAEVPLGFVKAPPSPELQAKLTTDDMTDVAGMLVMMPSDEQNAELRVLVNKFVTAKARLFKRLEIYKK